MTFPFRKEKLISIKRMISEESFFSRNTGEVMLANRQNAALVKIKGH